MDKSINKIIVKVDTVERIVFHFNKKHNEDNTIPQWVIKCKGQTYYCHHLESTVGFSTKETPDNSHTKGSLQFRGKLEIKVENGIITAIVS
jgi:hypothetical protein